jgi:hypothetical protein
MFDERLSASKAWSLAMFDVTVPESVLIEVMDLDRDN